MEKSQHSDMRSSESSHTHSVAQRATRSAGEKSARPRGGAHPGLLCALGALAEAPSKWGAAGGQGGKGSWAEVRVRDTGAGEGGAGKLVNAGSPPARAASPLAYGTIHSRYQ